MPEPATTRLELAVGLPLAALAGAVVGVLGTLKHQVGVGAVSGTGVPYGLVLSLGMVLVVLLALRTGLPSRLHPLAAAAGAVAAALVLTRPGPGGSVIVLQTGWVGTAWSVGVVVVGAAVVVVPRRRRARTASGRAGDGMMGGQSEGAPTA